MKYNRHAKMLDIIENNVIETQDDLADKLRIENGCYSGNDIKRYQGIKTDKVLTLTKYRYSL